MTFSILVATPITAFGDLIHNSLEESGRFRVEVVQTALEAHESMKSGVHGIVIIDSDLEGNGMRCLTEELNDTHPDLKLILIPPENNPRHSMMEGLKCNAYLRKPFYLPDLLVLIDELAADSFSESVGAEPEPGWLVGTDLEELIATAGARAVLVTMADGTAVFGGILPEGAHGELLELAGRFWHRPIQTDLVRFVRLQGEEQDTLLYLTAVKKIGDTCLGLLYPVTTPLSKVRAQAGVFVHGLQALATKPRLKDEKSIPAQLPALLQATSEEPPADGKDPFLECLGEDDQREDDALRYFNLAEIFGTIPSPDPNGKFKDVGSDRLGEDWMPEAMVPFQVGKIASDGMEGVQLERIAENELDQPASKDPLSGGGYEESALDADAAIADEPSLSWVMETEEQDKEMPGLDLDKFASGSIEDVSIFNRPLPVLEDEDIRDFRGEGSHEFHIIEAGQANFERAAGQIPAGIEPEKPSETGPSEIPPGANQNPLSGEPAQNDLMASDFASPASLVSTEAETNRIDYTCVLVPRLPQHFLAGELSECVSQRVQQLCQDLGWRLEGISLRPEYLQWTVQVVPTISPENVVAVIRQRTSEYIFGQFERLRLQNAAGDFWADGFLVVSGPQLPSAQLVREYIAQTRRQGVIRAPEDSTPSFVS